jgi:hypothetical protein
MIAFDLFLQLLLALSQLSQGLVHRLHFLLTFDALPVFTANVAGDGIQNPLEFVRTGYLSQLFQLQQETDGPRFHHGEIGSNKQVKTKIIG